MSASILAKKKKEQQGGSGWQRIFLLTPVTGSRWQHCSSWQHKVRRAGAA